MAKKITLHKVNTWEEKDRGFPAGTLRVYISNLWLGSCIPVVGTDEYHFSSHVQFVHIASRKRSLEEIINDCELSLKEFAVKIVKSYE